MATTADNVTLAARVYSVVRRRILRGALRPGQPLSRRRLAGELGMSVLPVNEALQRLEIEGLLQSRPRAGTRVRVPSEEDVLGHYVVREALEVEAARRAAEMATSQQIARLRSLAEQVDTAGTETDDRVYAALHQRLHHRIAACSRCQALVDALEHSHALAMLWMCRPSPGGRRHQDLVDAIASRDSGVAADAMRCHLEAGLQKSLDALLPYFSLQTGTASFTRGRQRRRRRA